MAITNGYCTLAEFKNYNKISSTDATDDTVIEDIIEGISREFDRVCGRTFYARTETHYYDTPESETLNIDDDDLLTITTLTNGDGAVLNSTYYKLLPNNLSPKYKVKLLYSMGAYWTTGTNGNPTGAITILGTYGYSSTVPEEIRERCKYETQVDYHRRFGENMSSTATVTGAGVVITAAGFSKKTYQILAGYRKLT
jgi:hypothetical protein